MGEISTADARLGVYTPLFRPAVRWVLGSFYWWKFSWPDSIRDCRFSGQPAKLKRFNSWNFVLVSMSMLSGFSAILLWQLQRWMGATIGGRWYALESYFNSIYDIYIYIHTNWSLVHIALLVPTISPLFNHHLFETLDPTRSGPHLSRYPPWPETSVFPPWFLAYLRWPNLLGKSKSFAGGLARRLWSTAREKTKINSKAPRLVFG